MPSQRALDAMAAAVRRAREATPGAGASGPGGGGPAPSPTRVGRRGRPAAIRAAPRWLVRGFGVALLLVVLIGLADVALLVSKHLGARSSAGRSPRRGGHSVTTTVAPPTTRPSPPPSTTTTTSTTSTTTTTSTTSTTSTTTTTLPAVGRPQLFSVTPSQGRAGIVVVVHGTNLFSPNGLILARVDGRPAPTDCPSQTSCEVTIPPLPGSASEVPVTVTTESGTSNAVMFHYG